MGSDRRIVITGLGAVTPIGTGKKEYWDALLAGKSGVSLVTDFDCSAIGTRIAAQVKDFNVEDYIEDRKEAKRMDRFVHLAMASSILALKDSGLVVDDSNRHRIGTFIGSGIG